MELKNKIIAHLTKEGHCSPEGEEYEIDLLIKNIKFADIAMEDKTLSKHVL
jgi:hypothetical protein